MNLLLQVNMSEELNGAGAVNVHIACAYVSCQLNGLKIGMDNVPMNKVTLDGLIAGISSALKKSKAK